MKALRYNKNTGVKVSNFIVNSLPKQSLRIKLLASGICATDMKIVDNKYYNKEVLIDNVILGHEGCGIIESTPSEKSHLNVGDHVVFETVRPCGNCEFCTQSYTNFCKNWSHIGINKDGTYADYIDLEQEQVHKVPSHIPWKVSVLTEPLAIALHSLNALKHLSFSNMAIVGPGIIGILHLIAFKLHGDIDIDVFGLHSDKARLKTAADKGAKTVFTAESFSNKYDLVIDTSGTAEGFKKALSLTSVGGICRTLSLSTDNTLSASDLVKSGVTVNSGRGITKTDMESAVKFISYNYSLLDGLCTHSYSLDEYEMAFENVRSGVGIKSVFRHK